ncbi:Hypothetical predicted protein [Olea europaea subsp. europaea]|uniref:Uncharacterized protein n=1 Tax=Olea europaea subsp. europaea TaxID=158383 RepID=A0A8S0UJ89_OLEEU|nr:Hypothetical predicted protein [Olea europaea subsp. europaea]
MATFPGFTNPSSPPDGNPGHVPPLGNVGASYMAMLSLPGLTVGLPMWLFSTSLVPTVSAVDLSPSTPTSMSTSSTSPGEMAKKKKKKPKNKKSPKGEVKSPVTAPSTPSSSTEVKTPSAPPRKADHLLHDCPGIPRILDAWSCDLARPSSSPNDATLSVGKGKGKGKVQFPCRLCEGTHPLHLCPLMDKASSVLESLTVPSPQLHVGYQRLSPAADHLPTDKEIDSNSSLAQAPLPEPGCTQPVPDQPLVGKSVDSSSPSVDHSVSEERNSHVLLVSSDSPEPKDDSLVPTALEDPPSVSLEQGGNHMVPPPSSSVISFDWSRLTTPPLPSHVPFWVTAYACNVALPGTLLDEGASVSLMPAPTWQALGSPPLVPVTPNLTAFDGGTSQPLGILPKFPITLGCKTIYIDMSVTQGSLDFSLFLGRD